MALKRPKKIEKEELLNWFQQIDLSEINDNVFNCFSNILVSNESLQPENYSRFKLDRYKASYQRHSMKIDRIQNIEDRLDKENIDIKDLIGDQKCEQQIPQWSSKTNINLQENKEQDHWNFYNKNMKSRQEYQFWSIVSSLTVLEPFYKCWYYKDDQQSIQGPFGSNEMDIWNNKGFLKSGLQISWFQQNKFIKLEEFKLDQMKMFQLAMMYNYQQMNSVLRNNRNQEKSDLSIQQQYNKTKQQQNQYLNQYSQQIMNGAPSSSIDYHQQQINQKINKN